jgi:hypothetical protein
MYKNKKKLNKEKCHDGGEVYALFRFFTMELGIKLTR